MTVQTLPPGFVAVGDGTAPRVTTWGLEPTPGDPAFHTLSRVLRDAGGTVPAERVAALMSADPAALTHLLPPFAAVRADGGAVTAVADSMGFRPLYHSSPGVEGTAVLSTSAMAAAAARGAGLDETAVAVQSLLGWQVGQRTMHAGIDKLEPGAVVTLAGGAIRVAQPQDRDPGPLSLDDAVRSAARLLRQRLEILLDEHPEAVLQLTGGQDSRLLLSAIPPSRRRGLRAMTLGAAGSGDVRTAARLAQRYGLRHEVHDLVDTAALPAEEAWRLCRHAALQVDGSADPVAHAALGLAESRFDQGVRISGLGGEVARGFYYVGAVHDRPFDRPDAQRLADWRMFVNEAVDAAALRPQFREWARDAAHAAVYDALAAGGPEWFRATDQLYLRHRMQRWAGVTDTAVGYRRVVVNPMLDEEFIAIATRLAPADKAHSRFLARLQLELDPELGRIPLEGRPAPIAYAQPHALGSVARTVTTGRKAAKKIVQRLRGRGRPPAGGAVLAERVVEHWRAQPGLLDCAAVRTYADEAWIDALRAGRATARASTVGFLTCLIALAEPPDPARSGPRHA